MRYSETYRDHYRIVRVIWTWTGRVIYLARFERCGLQYIKPSDM